MQKHDFSDKSKPDERIHRVL